MLIDYIKEFCDTEYKRSKTNIRCPDCRHIGNCNRRCKDCLEEIHYPGRHPNGKKDYDCPNLINFYVCDYSCKYTSEIYYLLKESEIVQNLFNYRILSIGCGGCPDLMAFEAFAQTCGNNKPIAYMGIDKNPLWAPIHNQIKQYNNATISSVNLQIGDILSLLEQSAISCVNVIVLQYIISALFSAGQGNMVDRLFDLIINSVVKCKEAEEPFVIIINDVNSNKLGRDKFQHLVNKLRTAGFHGHFEQYYFDGRHIQNDFQRYGTKHSYNSAMPAEMATKYQEYDPWQFCTSAQLIIEIEGGEQV